MAALRGGLGVTVRVPASSANLGPGFDSIGLALGIWDEYTICLTDDRQISVEVTGEGASQVPRDGSHLVLRSLDHALERLGMSRPDGIQLVAGNAVPHGRGLGSSATAIVGGVVAAQGLCALAAQADIAAGSTIEVDLDLAGDISAELEGHPDNSSASVFGQATASWKEQGRYRTARLEVDPRVIPVALVPDTQLATSTARAALPAVVPHADAAVNSGRTALLGLALTSRPDLLLPATRDWLHQEYRRPAYPQSMELVDQWRAKGMAAFVSGAGPTVLILTDAQGAQQVQAPAGWQRLEPGIPAGGAQITAH